MSNNREPRRESGSFYTPPRLARHVVENAVAIWRRFHPDHSLHDARVLDPACGDGVFLLEALRLKLPGIYGVDVNPQAVAAARRAVLPSFRAAHSAAGKQPARETSARLLDASILTGNALLGADFSPPQLTERPYDWRQFDWRQAFPKVFTGAPAQSGFDMLLGNPPYVGMRRLSQGPLAAAKPYWSTRYQTARGAYDLYVLFLEQANRLLRPGGVGAMITPNKIGSLLYAQACRDMLLRETCLERIDDCSNLQLFPGVNVYPYVLYWRKAAPSQQQHVGVYEAAAVGRLPTRPRCRVLQATLRAKGVFALHAETDLEVRTPVAPLAELATLRCGVTGFQAAKIGAALREASEENGSSPDENVDKNAQQEGWDFVVSGSINRYHIRRGNVRFQKRRYALPRLPFDAPTVSPGKRKLFDDPKIVCSGLTKRLQAAWCESPLALGVQVFAAANLQVDAFYLLGLLNSKLLTFLFRQRHASKQLAGGYASVNKGQLGELPIRRIDFKNNLEKQWRQTIIDSAQKLHRRGGDNIPGAASQHLEQQLDAAVYRLYQITADEIARIETMCQELV